VRGAILRFKKTGEKMKNFRAYQLAKELHKKSQTVQLKAPYKDQFRRAVLSIALNLAEGSAKTSSADRKRIYEIALGSLRETQALIDILELNELEKIADQLGASIFKLCRSLTL
jgi:four helix bundle protein